MRRAITALVFVTAVGLSACASTDGPPERDAGADVAASQMVTVSYVTPVRLVAPVQARSISATTTTVADGLQRRLRELGMRVTHVEPDGALVIGRYAGTPNLWIDCGHARLGDSAAVLQPVATDELRLPSAWDGTPGEVVQQMELHARMTGRAEASDGAGTGTTVETVYVVRRDWTFNDPSGLVVEEAREFIDFTTTDQSSFSDGVTCLATGRLEQTVLGAVAQAGSP